MDLILMPIVVSAFGGCLLLAATLVSVALQFDRRTARAGKALCIYAAISILVGLMSCWAGFALMMVAWPLEHILLHLGNVLISVPVAIFWASGPAGILAGLFLARRLSSRKRKLSEIDHDLG